MIQLLIKFRVSSDAWSGQEKSINRLRMILKPITAGQDAAILNIIRACEQTIDLANHLIKTYKMGIPQDSSEVFYLLERKGVISFDLSEKLKKMVSFRNTVVHEYQNINLDIVISVINNNLNDLIEFSEVIMEYVNTSK
jgi:uncharacterized protein YutE (UPF0331/DUF86 family)